MLYRYDVIKNIYPDYKTAVLSDNGKFIRKYLNDFI